MYWLQYKQQSLILIENEFIRVNLLGGIATISFA